MHQCWALRRPRGDRERGAERSPTSSGNDVNGVSPHNLGAPTAMLLQIHVALSLIGIASGLVVLYGLVTGKPYGAAWTSLFLATTVLTSVTGFPLPPFGFDPPRAVVTLSLRLLALAVAR